MSKPRGAVSLVFVVAAAVAAAGSAAKKPAETTPTRECQDQLTLAGSSLTVVITVNAAYGKEWIYHDAPGMVAQELLANLNALGQIYYSEASGENPNLYINLTVNQESAGTEQDSAWASVTGLGFSGELFSVNSGAAPYTSVVEAISAVASNINSWLVSGWSTTSECRQPDGTIRPASS